MNYAFLYLLIMWSILEYMESVEYERGDSSVTVFTVMLYRLFCWGSIIVMCIRFIGVAWGILTALAVLLLFPDSFGFIGYVFIRNRNFQVMGFYALHCHVMISFTVWSYFSVKKGAFIKFLSNPD